VGNVFSDIVIPGGLYPEPPPSEGVLIPLGTGLPDAPASGGPYGRQSNAWVEVTVGTSTGGISVVVNTTNNAGVASIAGDTLYIGTNAPAAAAGVTLASLSGINPTNGAPITLAVNVGLLTFGGTNWTGALTVLNPYNGAAISLDVLDGMITDEN